MKTVFSRGSGYVVHFSVRIIFRIGRIDKDTLNRALSC